MGTQTSCISHPANQRLVVLREDYLKLCDGNHCAAALLNLFEHGHNYKLANQKDALHHNDVSERHGERGTQDTSLLQFYNQQELEDGLLKLYKRMVIRKGLDVLLKKGFVSVHKNPNPRYHFDQTHYFRFHPEVVQPQLIEIFDEPKMAHRRAENSSSSAKNGSWSAKNSSTRTLITSQITDLDPPSSPSGKTPPAEHKVIAAESKVSVQQVLDHLNVTTGKHFREPGEIPGCLRRSYTVGECLLVIDWWKAVKTVEDPDQLKYFDQDTPFRQSKFAKYLASAEAWDQDGRPIPLGTRLSTKGLKTIATAARIVEDIEHGNTGQSTFLRRLK